MNVTNTTQSGNSFQDFDGDDFSNNLIQDIGPLLALFGAEVTTQFLSQSISWADNILFAIGPLGVVTAVVSAIRVGAPQSLRSFIGRAREPRAEVEKELLSSTSKEVCEMWNGTSLVRVRGESSIVELLVVFTKDGTRPSPVEDEGLGLHIKESENNPIIEVRRKVGKDVESRGSLEIKDSNERSSPTTRRVPNIALNCLSPPNTAEIVIFCIISIILQAAFLCVDGLITYRWQWQKGGETVASYACPLVISGTLLLTVGMGVCSFVIQWSTGETWYRIRDGTDARIIWLQKKSVVEDQHFGSYAIFAPASRRTIVSSIRENHFQTDDTSLKNNPDFTLRMLVFKAVTVSAVVVSVAGYIIQFIGFRQMHWLAAMFQVILSVIMTGIRAFVRRNLSRQPQQQELPVGHELDWLATRTALYKPQRPEPESTTPQHENPPETEFSDDEKLESPRKRWPGDLVLWVSKQPKQPWYGSETSDENRVGWLIVDSPTTNGSAQLQDLKLSPQTPPPAQTVLRVRQRLRDLTMWDLSKDPESTSLSSAVSSLARAINAVMDCLSDSKMFKTRDKLKSDTYKWVVYVGDGESCSGNCQQGEFEVKKNGGKWVSSESELEAALSLWTYSLIKDHGQRLKAVNDYKYVDLKLPIMDEESLWWIPSSSRGDGVNSIWSHPFLPETTELKDRIIRQCAWKLFAKFMQCVAEDIEKVHGTSTGRLQYINNTRGSPGRDTKEVPREDAIEFQNTSIQHLVESVQASGLCSELYTHLAVTLPLVQRSNHGSGLELSKLPDPDSLVDEVLELARSLEKRELWQEAAELYSYLAKTCEYFGTSSRMLLKAVAVSAEFLFILSSVKKCYEMRADQRQIMHIEQASDTIGRAINACNPDAIRTIRQYYEMQGQSREMKTLAVSRIATRHYRRGSNAYNNLHKYFPNRLFKAISLGNIKEAREFLGRNDEDVRHRISERDKFGWTPLHYAIVLQTPTDGESSGSRKQSLVRELLRTGADPNAKNVLGYTPLHCAVLSQNAENMNLLIQFGADMNARAALGKTPLHLAAGIMNKSLLSALYDRGADVDARDHFGQTPMHDAALVGNMENVKFLIDAKASTSARESAGMTPAHYVCGQTRSDIPMVQNVLQAICLSDPAAPMKRDQDGRTLLHHAAKSGCLQAISFILPEGQSTRRDVVDSQIVEDQSGMTPFHWAAKTDNMKALQMLGRCCGWDDSANEATLQRSSLQWRRGLLHTAAAHKSHHILDLLLEKGWSLTNEVDDENRTALHLCQDERSAKRLIDSDASLSARDKLNKMPIHHAQDQDLIRFLLREHRKLTDEWKMVSYWQDFHKQTPLHIAIESRYSVQAISALTDGLPHLVNAQDDRLRTALHLLVDRKKFDEVEQIYIHLKTSLSEKARDSDGRTPMDYAIVQSNQEFVKTALAHPIESDPAGWLRLAASTGHVGIVMVLIDKYGTTHVNDRSYIDGKTPLHVAAEEGNMDVADLLVSKGADFSIQDHKGKTPLDFLISLDTRRAMEAKWKAIKG